MKRLQEQRAGIQGRFGVRSLGLFGSYARDEARSDSDVDLLVEFEGPVTFLEYMGLIEYLETLLGARVDLATHDKLKPRVRPNVERELIRVA
ncbi:MAG: nucleotidyltransferase family protein [Gemmatimonadaceae bacterium]